MTIIKVARYIQDRGSRPTQSPSERPSRNKWLASQSPVASFFDLADQEVLLGNSHLDLRPHARSLSLPRHNAMQHRPDLLQRRQGRCHRLPHPNPDLSPNHPRRSMVSIMAGMILRHPSHVHLRLRLRQQWPHPQYKKTLTKHFTTFLVRVKLSFMWPKTRSSRS